MLTRTIRTASGPLRLCVGAAVSLTRERPGNGGFRLLTYENDESMAEECVGLAQGMEIKVSSRVHIAPSRACARARTRGGGVCWALAP